MSSYTVPSSEVQTNRRSMFALLALAISAFGIGTTEFISVGLLPSISKDLNVSVTTAGLTVSLYALGAAVGAPVLTALTASMSRKTLLMWIMVIFIIGNGIAALATSFTILIIA
ncbi:MFS transporter, partial [Bacillus paranthracis]